MRDVFYPNLYSNEGECQREKIKPNHIFRNPEKQNFKPYLKGRPVKRTAFHRIGCRKQ